ncbi:MAG: hypothetical protein FK730_02855 [Asgard group archaeon]|nr:hypothetical protein [Asgard group archaeon]
MSGNTNNKSDLGFIIFLVLAVAILIPLSIGFDNFESLFRTMKIVLGIVFGIIIVGFGVIGYYFYKRKVKRKHTSKKEDKQKTQSELNNTNLENKDDKSKVEIEIINENSDVIDQKQANQDSDKLSIKLKELNSEFDL